MRRIRVGVLFGGKSGEHEVSLTSARNILSLLDPCKYQVYPIGISKRGELTSPEQTRAMLPGFCWDKLLPQEASEACGDPCEFLLPARHSERRAARTEPKLDVIFPVLHGPYGEDGTVQGLLEMAHIPYVGAGVLASALGMDKAFMKRAFFDAALPIVEYLAFVRKDWFSEASYYQQQILTEIGLPCFVKPANLGSSVGVSKVHSEQELAPAVDLAAQYDRKILVERAVDARELEISVLGNDDPVASTIGEILPGREFYDYEAKYHDPSSQTVIPASISEDVAGQVTDIAIRAFRALECRGLARVDFFLEKGTDKVILNEINTMPGFTPISMYQKLWEASGITGRELVDRLVYLAFEWKDLSHRRI